MDDYNPNYDRYPEPDHSDRKIPVVFWLVLGLAIEILVLGLILYKVW